MRVYVRGSPHERFWLHIAMGPANECWPWLSNTWDVYIRAGQTRTNRLVEAFPAGVFRQVADGGGAWWQSPDLEVVRGGSKSTGCASG